MTYLERGRISRMSGQPTRAGWALPAPASWRTWFGFIRRPALPDRADTRIAPGLAAVLKLFALDIAFMAVLLGSLALAVQIGFDMPEHMLDELALSAPLIALIVIGAPVGEEIAFRGWLSGRPGHLLATPLLIVALLALLGAAAPFGGESAGAMPLMIVAALAGLAAVAALFLLRKRNAVRWFQRHFAWFFWASALAFAAVHLTNFATAGPAMLPLVLPQFMLALLLGYLRVTHGLWSAVLLHMLHNGLFISLVLVSSSGGS